MINIISKSNIENINLVSNELLKLVKAKKFFFTSQYRDDVRVKGSNTLIELHRAFSSGYRFSDLKSDVQVDFDELKSLVSKMNDLLLNKTKFTTFKLKDYSLDIKPKLCRELVSDLEDLFILGEITRADIDDVYASLSKSTPKKYSSNDLRNESRKIYSSIRSAINEESQEIKTRSVEHYINMVNLIDPNNEFNTKKEFILAGKRKISDMSSLRLCLAYKFDNDLFHKLINDEFELLLTIASNQISSHCSIKTENPDIDVKRVSLGGKGFDIYMTIDGVSINARAIPVNGYFVRFHYRYIIT